MPVEVIYRRYVFATTHDNECPAHIPKHYEKVLNLLQLFWLTAFPQTNGSHLRVSHSVQNLDLKSAFSSSNEPLTEFCYFARDC